ncbi:hypothetical protein JTE90_000288 [Oedothorax gibbosus]|uniref:Uncharacterized protein n=1 Tax=Oedothorax gibbosus TaxID=931172 RepID=A0AAV6VSC9_9ARAC|nr:hypothetical protein JTE90_000288 [Oedothorax gibbosus]
MSKLQRRIKISNKTRNIVAQGVSFLNQVPPLSKPTHQGAKCIPRSAVSARWSESGHPIGPWRAMVALVTDDMCNGVSFWEDGEEVGLWEDEESSLGVGRDEVGENLDLDGRFFFKNLFCNKPFIYLENTHSLDRRI